MTPTNPLLDAARADAARGWPVFPLEPGGKRPAGWLAPHGLNDATTDAAVIERWWSATPTANVGLRTGVTFDVLDIDGPDALDRLEAWGAAHGAAVDIEGPTVKTPRGWHCYLAPTGRGNGVNVGDVAGIDWRGSGGYVVAPPSLRADGGRWEWMTGTPQDLGPETPIVDPPSWVAELLASKARTAAPMPTAPIIPLPRRHVSGSYGEAALVEEVRRVETAPEGTRNDALNTAVFSLATLVAAGRLDRDEAWDRLLAAGVRSGLPQREVERTMASGFGAGRQHPREVAR